MGVIDQSSLDFIDCLGGAYNVVAEALLSVYGVLDHDGYCGTVDHPLADFIGDLLDLLCEWAPS